MAPPARFSQATTAYPGGYQHHRSPRCASLSVCPSSYQLPFPAVLIRLCANCCSCVSSHDLGENPELCGRGAVLPRPLQHRTPLLPGLHELPLIPHSPFSYLSNGRTGGGGTGLGRRVWQ